MTLEAAGGTGPPYRWSVTDGALPDGLALHQNTVEISGTPTVSGTFTVRVMAADRLDSSPAKRFTVTIAAASVTTTTPPTASSSTVAPTSTSSTATSAPATTTSTVAPISAGGGLADTGFEARPGLLVGAIALLLGISLVAAGRDRRDSGSHPG